jgi:nicotinate-nucleotide adenylyltransferase
MGGTFDPIHNGHLFVAEAARIAMQLDRVLFIPNGHPPHKLEASISSAQDRFAMVELAIADNHRFTCDDTEMKRGGKSYAVDTLAELSLRMPSAAIYYIMGVDALSEILTWKEPQRVMTLASFVAVTRPGYDVEVDLECLPESFPESFRNSLSILDLTEVGLDISSTTIRNRIAAGEPVRYLAPDRVIEYIEQHRLYLLQNQ